MPEPAIAVAPSGILESSETDGVAVGWVTVSGLVLVTDGSPLVVTTVACWTLETGTVLVIYPVVPFTILGGIVEIMVVTSGELEDSLVVVMVDGGLLDVPVITIVMVVALITVVVPLIVSVVAGWVIVSVEVAPLLGIVTEVKVASLDDEVSEV